MNVLELKTMSWTQPEVTGELPAGRNGHTMTAMGSKLYLLGGRRSSETLWDVHIFDSQRLEWSRPDIRGTPPSSGAIACYI